MNKWTSRRLDELDLIQDPETGLALLSKRPDEETPEQNTNANSGNTNSRIGGPGVPATWRRSAHAVTDCMLL